MVKSIDQLLTINYKKKGIIYVFQRCLQEVMFGGPQINEEEICKTGLKEMRWQGNNVI
jgi:hypothetical protein